MKNVDRVVSFAKELSEKVPEVDFWVSLDETRDHAKFTDSDWSAVPAADTPIVRMGAKGQLNLVEKNHMSAHHLAAAFQNASLPVHLHTYTEKNIVDEYPAVVQAASRAREACRSEKWCQQ